MSTPFDWENRPQAFPEPVDPDELIAEFRSICNDMARACDQYVEDVEAEERAKTEECLKTWGIQ